MYSLPRFPTVATALVLLFVFLSVDLTVAQRRSKGTRRGDSPAAGLVAEGDKLLDSKRWEEAVAVYKLAIKLDPKYPPAHRGLGDAYLNIGNWDEALVAYKEQARLAPNDADAQNDLGYLYNQLGRHGEAFAPLVKATGLDPTFAEPHYGIGYAYLRGADFEKSIGFFRSAIRLKPDYAEAYYGLASAYARLGKADLAQEQLKKLATLDPKLARRLEKELQATPASTQVATTKPAAPVASEPQIVEAAKPETPPAVQNKQPETISRQLQQIEEKKETPTVSQPQTTSPASNVISQLDEVKSLPPTAKRWALVIGVDKYLDPQISPLKGSDNDARLIAEALVRYASFPQDQVILLATNQPIERQPTRVNILRRLANLATTVPKDGLLLVSFAGHGMERAGQAFLLPSDAQISDQISFLEDTALSINRIKQRIKETGVAQVVILLDACRNDPGGRADAPNALTTAYTSGFNFDIRNREVQAFATVYATGIGQRAYEYTEKKQGYFSWAIVEGLKGAAANQSGEITLSELVKYVQENVPKRIAIDLGSTKQQRPFAVIEGYRADELVMAVTSTARMPTDATPTVAMVDPAAIELAFWDTIKNSNNPDDFKGYLDKYPDGQFAALARSRAQGVRAPASLTTPVDGNSMEMTFWNAIKDSRNPDDFRAYVTKFPNGLFVEIANGRIAMIMNEAAERERLREAAAAEERAKNTRMFDVKDSSGTEGTLTVAPGTLSFEVRKRSEKNDKKNWTLQCTQIRRVEAGRSAFQPPHVNFLLFPTEGSKKEPVVAVYTSSGGQGLFVNKPVVDITADVISSVIANCRMTRVN